MDNWGSYIKLKEWKDTTEDEIAAMKRNQTWTVISLPKTHHVVGSKWVYKVKYTTDGKVDCYKAWLVAKGYSQQEVDFFDNFSPVAKIVTVKVLFTLAITYNWSLEQTNVNNVFINGDLFEEVHMALPLRYKTSFLNIWDWLNTYWA